MTSPVDGSPARESTEIGAEQQPTTTFTPATLAQFDRFARGYVAAMAERNAMTRADDQSDGWWTPERSAEYNRLNGNVRTAESLCAISLAVAMLGSDRLDAAMVTK